MDITYKTYTNRKHTLYFLLLLASYICLVDGCKCGPSLSGHGKKDEKVSISNGYNLLTIGCMEGAKQSFIVRLDLPFSYMNLPSQSYLVVIGLPKNDIWSQKKWQKDLSKRVIQSIGDGMQRSWGRDNTFIFLHKANKLSRPILSVELEEADYHALMHGSHDAYVIAFDPKKPNTPLDYSGPIPLVGKPQPLPAYSGIGLQAQYAIREEMAGQSKWRIQGSMDNSYPIKNTRDIEVGFLLVKEQSTYDPWCLVQQRVIDKSDNAANYLDDVIMVPATLNTTDCLITSERSSNNLPQQGRFKLLAYLKQGNHYYVGQMDHLASKGVNTTNKAQKPPPTIDFEDYSLKLPRLEILLHKTDFSDTIQDVTLEGLDIHHCIKGVQTTWPSGVTGCLLLRRKETSDQAHLSTLECNRVTDLFSALQPAQNSAITQDKKLCLIANQTKKITPLSLPFFELEPGYTFFICGFSEKDKRLQYYTALDSCVVTIMEKQKSNFVIPDNGAKHGPIHSATPSIKDDIIPSNQSENLQPSKEITGIFSMDDCEMGNTLFERQINIQGVICIKGDTTQLLSLDDLAKYVSDYLQNSAKCKPTEGVFVFKNGEVEQEAIAIGHKPNKFYHWSTGLNKPTSGNDVELCQGHNGTLK